MSDTLSHSVSVFGLGYVGCISAACLAWLGGHRVIGVDVNPDKTEALRRGGCRRWSRNE